MNKTMSRAAAGVGSLAIAAAFVVSCSATKDATKSAVSAASSGASAAGSAVSSGASAAGSAVSSGASAAGSVASSGASVAGSAVSSGASAASSVVSSVLNPTTLKVPGIGDVSLDGVAATAYDKLGGAAVLGAPLAVAKKVGDGTEYAFANGTIFETPSGGAYLVQGEILKRYLDEQGGPTGALGWPTADETTTGGGEKVAGGGWISEFEHGEMTWLNDGKGNFKETVTKK